MAHNYPSADLGITGFLRTLPPYEVHSLLYTSSGGLIKAASDEEAISLLPKCTNDVKLLYRQRVKKEYLMKYLISRNVRFPTNPDKNELCRAVLDYWEKYNALNLKFNEKPYQNEFPSVNSSTPNSNIPMQNAVAIPEDDLMDSGYEESLGERQGVRFTQWFYQMLNCQEDFGPHHFWSNCDLHMEYVTNSCKRGSLEIIENGQMCFEHLRELATTQKLFFQPNLLPNSGGVTGRIDRFGTFEVFVKGMIHRKSTLEAPSILFAQKFLLISDPSTDLFKIKSTALFMEEQQMMTTCATPAIWNP